MYKCESGIESGKIILRIFYPVSRLYYNTHIFISLVENNFVYILCGRIQLRGQKAGFKSTALYPVDIGYNISYPADIGNKASYPAGYRICKKAGYHYPARSFPTSLTAHYLDRGNDLQASELGGLPAVPSRFSLHF